MIYVADYNKAMTLSIRNGFCDGTYMYDSLHHVSELAAEDENYESANANYCGRFAATI